MNIRLGKENILLFLAAVILVSAGTLIEWMWVCTPLGLGLYFLSLSRAASARISLAYGGVFGTIISASASAWLWGALPLTWLLGNSYIYQVGGVFIAWLVVSVSFSLGIVLTAPLIWYMRSNVFFLYTIPLIWAFTEELRMWCVAFVTLGKESLLGAHFSYPALGYSLTHSAFLLQFAQIDGITTLNILVGIFASVVVLTARTYLEKVEMQKYVQTLAVVTVLFLLCGNFLNHTQRRTNGAPVRVSLLTSYEQNTPHELPRTAASTVLEANVSALTDADIVLLPEGIMWPESLLVQSSQHFKSDALLITALHTVSPSGKTFSELSYKTPVGNVLGTYKKMLLMPIGEYLPYLTQIEFAVVDTKEAHAYISQQGAHLIRGTDATTITWRGVHIGGLICSDIQSPVLFKRIEATSGAGVLVQIGNTVWLHGSHQLFSENMAIAKVHAVQNNAYYLAANNMEPSFILSPSGGIIAEGTWWKSSLVSATIYPE